MLTLHVHVRCVMTALLGCLFLGGCATTPPARQPVNTVVATDDPEPAPESEMRSPFMFREAELPAGFPPPGPLDEVVIKDYPAYRLARVRAAALGRNGTQNGMFRPLFNHIKRNDIAMTAPVEMVYAGATNQADSMAFLYRWPTLGQPGPDIADARVQVEDRPPLTVLSIAQRGGYNERNFERGLQRLRAYASERADRLRIVGPPRYMAYNSPFVPGFLKLGEVQLPVERVVDVTRH